MSCCRARSRGCVDYGSRPHAEPLVIPGPHASGGAPERCEQLMQVSPKNRSASRRVRYKTILIPEHLTVILPRSLHFAARRPKCTEIRSPGLCKRESRVAASRRLSLKKWPKRKADLSPATC